MNKLIENNKDIICKIYGEELLPIKFNWENSALRQHEVITDIFTKKLDWFTLKIGYKFVGWCDGEKLAVKPNVGIAAMVEDSEGEQYWLHILNIFLVDILRENKL